MAPPLTITCTRCSSTVPWGPYCPECSAYLEFAGDPPWDPKTSPTPEPQIFEESNPLPAAAQETVVNDVIVDEYSAEDVIVDEYSAEEVVEVPAEFEELFHPEELAPTGRIGVKKLLEVAGIALFGAVIVFFVGRMTNWWAAGAVGIFIGAWYALLIGSWFSARQQTVAVPVALSVTEVIARQLPELTEEVYVEKAAPSVLEARAPQELPSQVVERTVATTTRTVHGDTACPTCGQLNEATRIFCDWCGTSMPGVELQPEMVEVELLSEAATEDETARQSRHLTRSWRTPIIVFSLLGVFLSAVIFALFGPNAFRVQFGLTQVYQSINQFINPTAGTLVTPVNVVASSSLEGTSASAALGGDGRTFWASASYFGLGRGSTLDFTLNDETIIDRMVILPGIQGKQFGIRALATPKDIKLTFMDGSTFETQLLAVTSDRDFRQVVEFPRSRTNSVTLEIVTVYPPFGEDAESWGEVAISGVEFISPPLPPQFLRLPTEMPAPRNFPGS
jgi:hypothetical protein